MQIINHKNIYIENKIEKEIYDSLPKPIIYTHKSKDLIGYKGKNVKISIIDSGCPSHKNIKITGEKVNFCDNSSNITDCLGHSTLITGIIGANNKGSIVGLAPGATIYHAKVINNDGNCNFNSLVAATLWSLTKEVDIIVMALGTKYDYMIFHDAIQKVKNKNICVFAAAGNDIFENEIDFPAKYPEVFSVSSLKRSNKNNHIIKKKVDFACHYKEFYTTYLNNKYIKMTGSSVATAYMSGLAALLIEKYKKDGKIENLHQKIYSDLLKII